MLVQKPDSEKPDDLPEVFPLRTGLEVHPRADSEYVVLEDTERNKFFRLGPAEAIFVENLRETSSPAKARAHTIAIDSTFTLDNAVGLCKWLATNDLVHGEPAGSAPRHAALPSPLMLAFFWKVRLFNPDRWLKTLVHYAGWLFSPRAMLIGILFFIIGLLQTTGRWAEFYDCYANLFTSWRGLSLAIAWFLLKIIHETAHGATCRRYAGEVNEAGLAMILFLPVAYVDVTSSWRFASRWQRLHVTLAGVAAELFVAGVALILWNVVDSLQFKQAASDVVLLASVSSLLFNLNPLLKFDGYFALADATGVDNLYSYGQSYARYFGARYVLGLDCAAPKFRSSRAGWIKFYGLAAAVYRVFTVTGLLVGAAALFSGAGIVIAAGGIAAMVILPLVKLVLHLRKLRSEGNLSYGRLMLRLGLLLTATGCALGCIPTSWTRTSPAVVQYDPPVVLRPKTAGFVETIHVRDGTRVVQGQAIVTLRNDDLVLQLSELRKSLAHTEQKILAAQWHSESSELGEASSAKAGLVQQVAELQEQIDALTVRSPVNGTLVARKLHLLIGTHVEAGRELAMVGREDAKRLKVSISQADAKQSATWIKRPMRIVVSGQPAMLGTIYRLDGRAESIPPHEALLAVNGGSLASVQTPDGQFDLDEARINGYIKLSPSLSRALRCGQKAHVRIETRGQTLGSLQFHSLRNRILQFLPPRMPWE